MTENVLATIVRELDDLAAPLARIADARDPEHALRALRALLRGAGWRLTAEVDPQPIIDGVGALQDAIVAALDGVEPDDLGAFLTALDGVRSLITALDDLIELIGDTGTTPPDPADLAAFGEDVLHHLAASWIRRKAILGDLAVPLGLLEVVQLEERTVGGWLARDRTRATRLRPASVTDLLADPLRYLKGRVAPNAWASSADAAATSLLLSQQLSPLMDRVNGTWRVHANALESGQQLADRGRLGWVDVTLPLPEEGHAQLGAEYVFFSADDANAAGAHGPAVELAPYGSYRHEFDQGSWSLTVALALALGGVDIGDSPPLLRFTSAGVEAAASLDARLDIGAQLALSRVIGGQGTRIELGALDVAAFAAVTSGVFDTGASLVASGSKIVLSAADLGDAVAAVAQFESTLEVDLGLQWSLLEGVTVAGSATLEIEFTEGLDLGGIVVLSGLRVRLALAETIELGALTDVRVNLGPVAMSFEDLGLALELSFPPGGGNLGAADFGVAIQPPKGIGVRVDAAVIVGGGFLSHDADRGEYAGVLELSFPAMSLSLKAVGIFTTKLPGGADGYALLLLVFAEFPAIQLGYGFTLNGVGGILGIQHGVSIDALQSGMRTGAMDSVLFPDDPVANAPALLDDVRAIFPLSPGSLTLGPALQIGWGAGIVTISLGLVLQFDDVIGPGAGDPSIARIVLLGQLKVVLPPVEGVPEIIRILVDILGYYDFDEQELGVDARLRDSHLVGLPLTGSLVVRARFGDDPTFLLAVGGFHPRFTDLPPGLPQQDRLGVQLVYDLVTVRIQSYTAITSNSFQFGAEASLLVKGGDFKVEAYLGFDALFLFVPVFHFTFDFRVGAAISWKGHDLAAIRVRGTVTGPGRWEITGAASFKILCFDVDIDFHETWGSAPAALLREAPILPDVLAAFAAFESWSARLPSGRPLVTLRDPGPDGGVMERVTVHPLGSLEARQKVVPLGVQVEKVGGTRPTDAHRFDVTGVQVGGKSIARDLSQEHFARGDYFELSEDDKLTSPSFERFDAGVRIGTSDFKAPAAVAFDPEYETAYLEADQPSQRDRLIGHLLLAQTAFGAVARAQSTMAGRLLGEERLALTVEPSPHAVVRPTDHAELGTAPNFTLATQAAAAATGAAIVVEAAELVR